jgi:GR25 family glycosyltransferase involved in LPS biosynthesis
MRVGVTVNFQHSFFSSGSPQTVLSIAETMRACGHEVTLINVGDKERVWWDDLLTLKDSWTSVDHYDVFAGSLDCVIEVGSNFMKRRTGVHIWLNRKAPLFHDVEASLFPIQGERSLEGISEIWLIAEYCTSDDVQYMELLTRKTVRLVPFIWTPMALEIYRQETKAPVWQQVANMPESLGIPWSIHICETNMSSSSSSTIPLLIAREATKAGCSINKNIKVHNADNIKETKFFKENVLSHIFSDIDATPQFVGRQRVIDWVYDPKSIVIAHSRFYKIRPYHFDCLWSGIPLVHNSELIRNLASGFYADNEISQGFEAFQAVIAAPQTLDQLIAVRQKILDEFSPLTTRIQKAWSDALNACQTTLAPSSVPSSVPSSSPELRVAFSDMWDLFNPEYNMFTLMLEAAIPGRKVVGFALDQAKGQGQADILIFGPFGDAWKSFNGPKVHFTGENTEPITEGVVLNLGFKHVDCNDGKYLRLPLWMLEINWFNADAERIANPKPLPIDRCCKVFPEEIANKTKFCAFVVTNPRQPMRNNAFQWLTNGYKKVDSAGRLFNNMGDGLFAGLGGGGGELIKHEFLKNYKFSLAFENESADGYTTEKWLHAKAAGCIPIYWGDPKVERDFDMDGCIDARGVKTSAELIDLVKKVDTNGSEWLRKVSKPALDEVRRDLVRRTLSECALRIWKAAGASAAELQAIPRFLGDTETRETVSVPKVSVLNGVSEMPNASVKPLVQPVSDPLVHANVDPLVHASMDATTFVTAANARFLPSLEIWMNAIAPQKKEIPELGVIVYFFKDVGEEARSSFAETYPFVEVRDVPSEEMGFSDLWDPQHFAWKLWILNELMGEAKLAGKILFYMDAGVMMCRWPREWLAAARKGICLLEDPRQTNASWCHDAFIRRLSVTTEELAEQQIWAGSIACLAGSQPAVTLFAEAWKLAQIREVIAGEKWSGMRNGKPFGHRHDQSILSILSSRYKLPRINMDTVYCDVSLRQTYLTKKSLYAHRGLYQVHHPLASDIDDAWVINLDRRADRMASFVKANPDIAERVHRVSAFEGAKLKLGPKLARLFAPHDFNWKKPVMGCALSHLALWMQLANERPEINSYLILEDDARLQPNWRERWEKIQNHDCMPEGWDVMYLGGILPPNKEGFATVIEPVNKYVARIKEHQLFGQPSPNRYMHFCAYAYVLSRRGAEKILEVLKAKGGYWTSADHMICNIHEHLNIYFTNPLLAGCFQDDDPSYCNSKFNDFSRVDKFDSDLWNNTDRFTPEEVRAVANDSELDIGGALVEARVSIAVAEPLASIAVAEPLASIAAPVAPVECIVPSSTLTSPAQPFVKAKASRFVSLVAMDMSKWYEFAWIKQIFSFMPNFEIELLRHDDRPTDVPIVVVQRPVEETAIVLKGWSDAGLEFYVLHMSDEFCSDPIDFYKLPGCKGVVRNYLRTEESKVVTIPLGFHWAIPNGEPYIHTPRPPFRELAWSFVGTGWLGRREKLNPLTLVDENKVVFMDDWNSPDMLAREECLSIMLNSWCIPCPSGHNGETFRFYEALEAGAVPIVVRENNEAFLKFVASHFQIMVANNWEHAAQLVYTLKKQTEVYEKYRNGVLAGWEGMKRKAKEDVRKLLEKS